MIHSTIQLTEFNPKSKTSNVGIAEKSYGWASEYLGIVVVSYRPER